jgi:type IV pilus assembly protein PilC
LPDWRLTVPRFEYVAKSPGGMERSSAIHAESAEAAADLLHRDGLVVLSLREVGDSIRERLTRGTSFLTGGVPTSAVALFTKQLASMVNAGLPLIRALHGLAREERNATLANVLLQVATDIEGGDALSSALSRHGRIFPKLYVSMVRSGERSGTLGVILDHLVKYMNRTEAVKRKVKSAMTYPVFVVVFALVAFTVLMVRIVPMMAGIYAKLGADLPRPTQLVITTSHIVASNLLYFIIALVALVVTYQVLNRRPDGKYFLDRLKLRIPIFGRILKKVVVAKFLRTLGILVVSGLPILEALELSGGGSGNQVIERAANRIAKLVSKGSSLSSGFHQAAVFPEIVVQMVSTGEETGRLGDMLSAVSDHYDEEVEASIEGLASVIEPLMIVFVGGIIAIVLVAMFLPVFYLGGAIRQGLK